MHLCRPRQLLATGLAAVLLLACSDESRTSLESSEARRVKQNFRAYREAILSGDGELAAGLVTTNTLDYYGKMRQLAATAGRQEIVQQSFLNRMFITLARHQIGVTKLQEMTGKDIFILAVQQGWIGENVSQLDIGIVTVIGQTASGEIIRQGERAPGVSWQFRKEDGDWRLDLTSFLRLPLLDLVLRDEAKKAGLTEDEFIFLISETLSGRRVPDDIWEKPSPK